MKLHTSIQPRRDGTVNVKGLDGQPYAFTRDDDGELACEIEHEPTLAFLLASENFYPANAEDHGRAVAIVAPEAGADEDDEDDEDDADDEVETEVVNGGLPIEAGTPPMVAPDLAARHNDAILAAKKGTQVKAPKAPKAPKA